MRILEIKAEKIIIRTDVIMRNLFGIDEDEETSEEESPIRSVDITAHCS